MTDEEILKAAKEYADQWKNNMSVCRATVIGGFVAGANYLRGEYEKRNSRNDDSSGTSNSGSDIWDAVLG